MEYILGIDIGTGSTKAVAVGTDHVAADSSQFFYPTNTVQQGYSEQDPEAIWKAFCLCIEEVTGRQRASPLAVSLSSAMHSVIAVDEQGNALAPMMTWADSRSTTVAERLLSSTIGAELYQLTGTPVHSMSPLCKIIWIRENQPELFEKTFKFISIKEYIWFKLFRTFECDHSIASCTGLMDVEKLEWSAEALTVAGIKLSHLSALVPTGYTRRDFDQAFTFLAEDTAIVIGASDGCLANLGTGAATPGAAALTIGTSGALRVASKTAVFNPQAMTFSYRLDEETFINGGPINNGGIALKWHLKNIYDKEELEGRDYELALSNIAEISPGADGLTFLPYLQGERAPIWDSKSCGTFFGLNLKHRTPHFTSAVIEGVCFALNDVLQSLLSSGQMIGQLHVSGGFVSSEIWLQILADITGKNLVLAATEDASAIGAAYLALKAIGHSAAHIQPDQSHSKTIRPDEKKHLLYQQYFKRYKKVYESLKEVMHELSDA